MKKIIYILSLLTIFFNLVNAKSLRIESIELSKNLDTYKIIDTRTPIYFKDNHILGALNFPIINTYQDKTVNGRIANPDKMQALFQNLGLNINDKIVVYDNGDFFDSARLFWSMEVYGFKDVKILNDSFENWENNNLQTSTEIIKPKRSNYTSQINHKRLASKLRTQIASKNPNQVIIDARGHNEYIGKASTAKRFGHIPKAIYIPATHNLNYNDTKTKIKSLIELKNVYKDIDKNKKIIIYCAIGRVASTNYFALRELDYNVSNYDASWNEWGNDTSLPITNLSEK